MDFEFSTTGRIIFGNGAIRQLPALAAAFGKNACIVTGRHTGRIDSSVNALKSAGMNISVLNVSTEPTVDFVLHCINDVRAKGCDVIIGIGGGSVIDAGKVISAMITNGGTLTDYLEVIGTGKPLTHAPAPYIAVPTTAGTGAEVTSNAVLASPEHKVKVSMRSRLMYPRIAIVDPELTYSMPPALTASTGIDALTQLIEAYVSNKANPMTDGICLEGLKRAGRSLSKAYSSGDKSAREDMCIASHFSGLALANAKLGAVHGFAGPLGGMFSAPHGMICARLLPFVFEANVNALRKQDPSAGILARFDTIAQVLTSDRSASALDAVRWIKKMCGEMKIPPLKEIGLTEDSIPAVVQQTKKSSSTKGNPVELSDEELANILRIAM